MIVAPYGLKLDGTPAKSKGGRPPKNGVRIRYMDKRVYENPMIPQLEARLKEARSVVDRLEQMILSARAIEAELNK